MTLLTPAQAKNLLHNLRRLGKGYNVGALDDLCVKLVGEEAAARLALILCRLADGNDEHVTLLKSDYPPVLGLLHQLSIAGVRVINHQKVVFYSIVSERLFEQIRVLWGVPYSWTTQLIVRQPVMQAGYSTYILSARWKLTREAVLRRDKHGCVRCGRRQNLQVHHKSYVHLGDEPLGDLITLCSTCHHLEHPGQNFGAVMKAVSHDPGN